MVIINENSMRINLERVVDESTDAIWSRNLFPLITKDLTKSPMGSRYAIITNSETEQDAQNLNDLLKSAGIKSEVYVSSAKSSGEALRIMGEMSKDGCGRDSAVISLENDNWSLGDNTIAGFVAAYFNRGVPLMLVSIDKDSDTLGLCGDCRISSTNGKAVLKADVSPKKTYVPGKKPSEHYENLTTKDDSYDIIFGNDMFTQIAEDLKGKKYAIITDSNVKGLYADSLKQKLADAGIEAEIFSVEAGEENKNFSTCEHIIEEMFKAGYSQSPILALGGGVTGDIAGFTGAMLNNPTFQLPTTLLAQVDSSVGGKTAVDTPYGKNLVGKIINPDGVFIDVATPTTQPIRDYRSGIAEMIKHGVILDEELLNYLEQNSDLILKKDLDSLLYIAKQNCRIKGQIVEKDPNEKGLRRILNYGHTIGHAIEMLSLQLYEKREIDYYLLHGEAIAIGMMAAGRIAIELNTGFTENHLQRLDELFERYRLTTAIPKEIFSGAIIGFTSRDKKAKNGQARYVLPTGIGEMHPFDGEYATHVDNTIVMNALQQTR